jgi:hypothetical protein
MGSNGQNRDPLPVAFRASGTSRVAYGTEVPEPVI